ncbi:hypothetical protein IFR04_011747 [Cadophora malorum]|uniref:NmrA-like domain-containing protein n=1 Tax=Cadophora malorum TaxID=108018 RepID=A0A8H7T5G8_9HELO|nr:hypothetical protein IFR04_011747 [Cadophora malorum]
MSSIQNVLFVGARGNVGPVIVQHLLAANLKVSILSRDSSTNSDFPTSILCRQTTQKNLLQKPAKAKM